eukprot:10761874-Alexandrium_andersonii.AAC.1
MLRPLRNRACRASNASSNAACCRVGAFESQWNTQQPSEGGGNHLASTVATTAPTSEQIWRICILKGPPGDAL